MFNLHVKKNPSNNFTLLEQNNSYTESLDNHIY